MDGQYSQKLFSNSLERIQMDQHRIVNHQPSRDPGSNNYSFLVAQIYLINTYMLIFCSNCEISKAEVCESCSLETMTRVNKYQQKLFQKYAAFELKNLTLLNHQAYSKKNTSKKISQIQKEVLKLQDRIRDYEDVKKDIEEILQQSRKQSQEGTEIIVMKQCLQTMIKRRQQNEAQIFLEKKRRKEVLSALAKTFDFDNFKYRIKKYFRYQEANNILDTKIEEMNGVEFISYIKQVKLQYTPQSNQSFIKDDLWLISNLKYSVKFFFQVYRNLLHSLKLPYEMQINQQFCYIGNIALEFNKNVQLSSPRLIQLLNLLQANILYVSHAYGLEDPPFLVIDQLFLQKVEKNKFRPAEKKGHSPIYLQALRASKILEYRILDHIEFDTGVFLIKKDSGMCASETDQIIIVQQQEEQNDDEVYQILQ